MTNADFINGIAKAQEDAKNLVQALMLLNEYSYTHEKSHPYIKSAMRRAKATNADLTNAKHV